MSIDIRITQKGLRKKTLPLEKLLGGKTGLWKWRWDKIRRRKTGWRRNFALSSATCQEDSASPGIRRRKLLWI